MKTINLLWIIPIILLIGVFIGFNISENENEEIFNLGSKLSCYEGCYNMIEIYEGKENKPYNESVKIKYDICSERCNTEFLGIKKDETK